MRLLLILGLVLLLGGWTPPAAPPPSGDQAAPQRVILRVNRNVEVAGFLALEDENVIAVRNLRGEVESFAKSRVAQIVRLVDPQPGQTGIAFLRDGETREGIVIEDVFEHVLMEIPAGSGIRAKLKREFVSHVILQPSFEQRYAEYKAALQPGMYDAHFVLCKWLFEQRRYELAERELRELLDQTEMSEARQLLKIVEAQLALLQPKPRSASTDSGSPEGAEVPEEHAADAPESQTGSTDTPTPGAGLISRADVNLIRVYEIDFDHPPKIIITPETVRALIEKYGANKQIPASQTGRNAMFRAASSQPIEIVRLMFDLRARDLYQEIRVNTEPHSLNLFRQRVHDTWLMNNCATSRCHGGPEPGRFYLLRKNHKDERVRYTNFLILERLKLDPDWPLINYETPEDSLIIQHALPRSEARRPHPDVDGWTAALTAPSGRVKQDAIEWIKAMMVPRPEYPVDFEPATLNRGESPPEETESARPGR